MFQTQAQTLTYWAQTSQQSQLTMMLIIFTAKKLNTYLVIVIFVINFMMEFL